MCVLFQDDVIEESPELLKLGVLFGQEVDIDTEDLPEVLSFQHKLIQEFFAALFIAKQVKDNKLDSSFLKAAFPTFSDLDVNRYILKFASGHLASQNERFITNHVANTLAEEICKDFSSRGLDQFYATLQSGSELLRSCHEEGIVSTINPYLCIYPSCGYPLVDAIKCSQLVVINDLNESDPLKLQSLSTPVVVHIVKHRCRGRERELDRLMTALASARINLLAVRTDPETMYCKICKLMSFPKLRAISSGWSTRLEEKQVRDLTDSINSWGPEPQLQALHCILPVLEDRRQAIALYIPFIKALSKCVNLQELILFDGNQIECVPALMGAPPPQLKRLWLLGPDQSINSSVWHSIVRAMRKQKLQYLQVLNTILGPQIQYDILYSLVEAFIDVRPDKPLEIIGYQYPPEIEVLCKNTKITLTDANQFFHQYDDRSKPLYGAFPFARYQPDFAEVPAPDGGTVSDIVSYTRESEMIP